MTPTFTSNFSEIAPHYDAFIFDAHGVLYWLEHAFPSAIDCLKKLKSMGKKIGILTNTSRKQGETIQYLAKKGITPDLYDVLLTAGQIAHDHLGSLHKDNPHPLKIYHLGKEHDTEWLAELNLIHTDDLPQAQFLLMTRIEHHPEITAYDDLLAEAARLGLPLVCANPDIVVRNWHDNSGDVLMAGAFAHRYQEQFGGTTILYGKPEAFAFDMMFYHLQIDPQQHRICMIGDTFHTDGKGAHAASIDFVFIKNGNHGHLLPDQNAVIDFTQKLRVFPKYVVHQVAWNTTPLLPENGLSR